MGCSYRRRDHGHADLFAYILIYVTTVPLIKFSILPFYRRIFGMTWTIGLCMFLAAGYFIACNFAFLVCCRSVSYYWSQYIDPAGGKWANGQMRLTSISILPRQCSCQRDKGRPHPSSPYPFDLETADANESENPYRWYFSVRRIVFISPSRFASGINTNIVQCLCCESSPNLLHDIPRSFGRYHLDYGRCFYLVQC